jgi:hypothetical protein
VIATTRNLDIESAFDLAQVFIKLTAKVCQAVVIGGLEDNVPRNLNGIQSIYEITAMCGNWEVSRSQIRETGCIVVHQGE